VAKGSHGNHFTKKLMLPGCAQQYKPPKKKILTLDIPNYGPFNHIGFQLKDDSPEKAE